MQMLSGTVDVELVRLKRSVLVVLPTWRAAPREVEEGDEEAGMPAVAIRWREWELKLFWLLTAIGCRLLRWDLRDMERCSRS